MSEITDKMDELVVHLETVQSTLVMCEQRIAELEGALRPFTEEEFENEPLWNDNELVAPRYFDLTYEDFRRARRALPPKITGGE